MFNLSCSPSRLVFLLYRKKPRKDITLHFCPSECLSRYWSVECTVAPARKLSEHLLVRRSTLLLAGDDQDLVAHTQSSLAPVSSTLLRAGTRRCQATGTQVIALIQ